MVGIPAHLTIRKCPYCQSNKPDLDDKVQRGFVRVALSLMTAPLSLKPSNYEVRSRYGTTNADEPVS
jgi:hypothetical protein